MSERKSTIDVNILDWTELRKQVTEKWLETHVGEKIANIQIEKVGFVQTPKGRFIICDEGVVNEYPIEDKKGRYVSKDLGEGKQSMPMFPEFTLTMTAELLDQTPVQGKENLATFIRTFGRRLEANFWIAQEHLTKKGAK